MVVRGGNSADFSRVRRCQPVRLPVRYRKAESVAVVPQVSPMAVEIVRGTNTKPASSGALADFFEANADLGGQLFIGFPIIGTPDGRYAVDALWISQTVGDVPPVLVRPGVGVRG